MQNLLLYLSGSLSVPATSTHLSGRDKEVLHEVEVPVDWLWVDCVMLLLLRCVTNYLRKNRKRRRYIFTPSSSYFLFPSTLLLPISLEEVAITSIFLPSFYLYSDTFPPVLQPDHSFYLVLCVTLYPCSKLRSPQTHYMHSTLYFLITSSDHSHFSPSTLCCLSVLALPSLYTYSFVSSQ